MMIQGMTGFGTAERGGYRVEIRSLNHRFMDIHVKLPPSLGKHDISIRDMLRKDFERGKFDVYVSATDAGAFSMKPDIENARSVKKTLEDLLKALDISETVGLDTLLPWRDLFLTEDISHDEQALFDAVEEAVSGLKEMRCREGENLAEEISMRGRAIAALNDEIDSLSPDVMEASRQKFQERLATLLADRDCDDAKLLQEAAAATERSDITEEITRLRNHVAHLQDIIESGGTVGRKLDFLLQEFNREANTIAAKTEDYRITSLVVSMKTEIEKTREQVQNIQ